MGMIIDGVWQADGNAQQITNGRYIRRDSQFRDWVTADGSSGFKAESGRYHLYIAVNCPWIVAQLEELARSAQAGRSARRSKVCEFTEAYGIPR